MGRNQCRCGKDKSYGNEFCDECKAGKTVYIKDAKNDEVREYLESEFPGLSKGAISAIISALHKKYFILKAST